MNFIKQIVSILIFSTIVFSCSRTIEDNRQAIMTAEESLEQTQYDNARKICEQLLNDEKATQLLTANDYCRIALILQKISDATDANDLTATAVNCYNSASKISGDTIMSFLSSLQPSDASSFLNVMLVANGQSLSFEGLGNDIDTISAENTALPIDTI